MIKAVIKIRWGVWERTRNREWRRPWRERCAGLRGGLLCITVKGLVKESHRLLANVIELIYLCRRECAVDRRDELAVMLEICLC